ncbi:hypothetical protein QJS10_CPA03g01003 [Acorus calamus]|uniref:SWIM-type domain-containing protein n=1 Tax=Acorus calamus TaxID=4465 RepID=A0AAV9F7A7_ACOCL|nr:hypothetical protein QJS10_CPA03g01003 [Acorus calamus]
MTTSTFMPRLNAKLMDAERECRHMRVLRYSLELFGVHDRWNNPYEVELKEIASCECNVPKLYHHPCSHVMAACMAIRVSYEEYVSKWYTTESYCLTYVPEFRPVRQKGFWPPVNLTLQPPDERRKKGRPRNTRRHMAMDERADHSGFRCSVYRNTGHNRGSCPNRVL